MTTIFKSSDHLIRQSQSSRKRPIESRTGHFKQFEERLFWVNLENLTDLLNGDRVRTVSMLGVTSDRQLVSVEDREKVVSLLNNFVTSVKQIQETLSLKPPLTNQGNPGGLRTLASHVFRQFKDRCEEEINELNRLLEKLEVRPRLYLELTAGRSLEVRMEATANREFSENVANALLTVMRLVERDELDTLRRCDCGDWYFASRSDQKSCSATCRQRRHSKTPEFRATRRAYRKTVKEMKNNKSKRRPKT